MMIRQQYPNHFIQSLSQAQKRRGDIPDGAITTGHTGVKGFTETPIQEDPPQADQAETEICPLSRRQLQDLQAVIAEVVEITPETNYIKILLPDGREETAFCGYASALKQGDQLFITSRQRGRQTTITILGLVPPDQRKKVTNV